jgi:hypothetical protein
MQGKSAAARNKFRTLQSVFWRFASGGQFPVLTSTMLKAKKSTATPEQKWNAQ